MAAFQFKREQIINSDIDTIWDFVSSPKNLKEITPSYILFQITSDNLDQKMYPGMIITYKVAPILNIKIDWEESDSQSKPAFAQRNETTNENAIKHQEDLQSKVIEIFDGEILR